MEMSQGMTDQPPEDQPAKDLRELAEQIQADYEQLQDDERAFMARTMAKLQAAQAAVVRPGVSDPVSQELLSRRTASSPPGATRTAPRGNDQPQTEHDEQYYYELRHQVLRRGSWLGIFGTSARSLDAALDRLKTAYGPKRELPSPSNVDPGYTPSRPGRGGGGGSVGYDPLSDVARAVPAEPHRVIVGSVLLNARDVRELQAGLLALRNELVNRETTPANYDRIIGQIDVLAVDLRDPAPYADAAMERIRLLKRWTADDAGISGMIDQLEQRIQQIQSRTDRHGEPENDDSLSRQREQPR
jgi:hypothetical protein